MLDGPRQRSAVSSTPPGFTRLVETRRHAALLAPSAARERCRDPASSADRTSAIRRPGGSVESGRSVSEIRTSIGLVAATVLASGRAGPTRRRSRPGQQRVSNTGPSRNDRRQHEYWSERRRTLSMTSMASALSNPPEWPSFEKCFRDRCVAIS